MKSSTRRRWLKTYVTMGIGSVLAGCTGPSDGSEDEETGGNRTPTSTPSPTPPPRETLHNERIFTDKRWPHEFDAGTMLYVKFDVIERGPGTFMFNETEFNGDIEDIRYRIDTAKTISHEILTTGLTYLEAVPRGEAEVLVEAEK